MVLAKLTLMRHGPVSDSFSQFFHHSLGCVQGEGKDTEGKVTASRKESKQGKGVCGGGVRERKYERTVQQKQEGEAIGWQR